MARMSTEEREQWKEGRMRGGVHTIQLRLLDLVVFVAIGVIKRLDHMMRYLIYWVHFEQVVETGIVADARGGYMASMEKRAK